jgi:hypothetical protein
MPKGDMTNTSEPVEDPSLIRGFGVLCDPEDGHRSVENWGSQRSVVRRNEILNEDI